MRVLWSKVLHPGIIKSVSGGNALPTDTDPTGNRTVRGISQYVVVGEGADRKTTSDSHTALVVSTSTEVRTTSEVIDYPHPHNQFQLPQHQLPPHVYDTYYAHGQGRPGGDVQPPFGVYAEAYALQTRQNGVWGR